VKKLAANLRYISSNSCQYMKNIKTTIIMIGLIMVVVGTTLAPIQSYATGSGGFSGTSSLKHGIRDGVTVNLEHRSQHMDQENLCYRANTCKQAKSGNSGHIIVPNDWKGQEVVVKIKKLEST
jgi:hypothetical protein